MDMISVGGGIFRIYEQIDVVTQAVLSNIVCVSVAYLHAGCC